MGSELKKIEKHFHLSLDLIICLPSSGVLNRSFIQELSQGRGLFSIILNTFGEDNEGTDEL
jgi:hypothetical protein